MAVLPQFTFLHGPTKTCHNFADEILNRCSCDVLDLEFPLISAMMELFYDTASDQHRIDPSDFEDRLTYLPFSDKVSVTTWLTMQRRQLREDLGPDILGRILQATYRIHYEDSGIPCIIRDCDDAADLKPIIDAYGGIQIWLVNLGPLTDKFVLPPNINTCWIAVTEAKKQVDQYLHELEAWGRKGAA